MNIDLNITGIDNLLRELKEISIHKIPKVTAMALTQAAIKYRKITTDILPTVFDRPTPWTMRSLFYSPASATKLESRVWFKDQDYAMSTKKGTPAAEYLMPQVYGRGRKEKRYESAMRRYGVLGQNQYTVPGKGAPLDRYGNISSQTIVKILTAVRALEGMAGATFYGKTGGYKLRKGTQNYFIKKGKDGQALGIWERHGKNKDDIRSILIFTKKQPQYRQRLPFFERGQEIIPGLVKSEFERLARDTIEHARR